MYNMKITWQPNKSNRGIFISHKVSSNSESIYCVTNAFHFSDQNYSFDNPEAERFSKIQNIANGDVIETFDGCKY